MTHTCWQYISTSCELYFGKLRLLHMGGGASQIMLFIEMYFDQCKNNVAIQSVCQYLL